MSPKANTAGIKQSNAFWRTAYEFLAHACVRAGKFCLCVCVFVFFVNLV